MFWFFHRGLSPHLQRAHAGRTQANEPDRPTAALRLLLAGGLLAAFDGSLSDRAGERRAVDDPTVTQVCETNFCFVVSCLPL